MDSNLQSRQGKIFFGLLEEAERIRLSLIVLIRSRQYIAETMPEQANAIQYLDQLIRSASVTLRDIAHELQSTPKFFRITQPQDDIKDALAALRQQDGIRFQGYRYIEPTLAGYAKEEVVIRYDPAECSLRSFLKSCSRWLDGAISMTSFPISRLRLQARLLSPRCSPAARSTTLLR
jgi:hypothetical protein